MIFRVEVEAPPSFPRAEAKPCVQSAQTVRPRTGFPQLAQVPRATAAGFLVGVVIAILQPLAHGHHHGFDGDGAVHLGGEFPEEFSEIGIHAADVDSGILRAFARDGAIGFRVVLVGGADVGDVFRRQGDGHGPESFLGGKRPLAGRVLPSILGRGSDDAIPSSPTFGVALADVEGHELEEVPDGRGGPHGAALEADGAERVRVVVVGDVLNGGDEVCVNHEESMNPTDWVVNRETAGSDRFLKRQRKRGF